MSAIVLTTQLANTKCSHGGAVALLPPDRHSAWQEDGQWAHIAACSSAGLPQMSHFAVVFERRTAYSQCQTGFRSML